MDRLEANWVRFMQVEPEGTGARRKSKKERKLEKGRQVAGEVDGLEDSVVE